MKSRIFILFIIILLITASGGYFWYWQKYRNLKEGELSIQNSEVKLNKEENKIERQVIPAKMSDEERFLVDIEVGNYKIFSDKLANFSFQYPKDWNYKITKDPYDLNVYYLSFGTSGGDRVGVYPWGRGTEGIVCMKIHEVCEYRVLTLSNSDVYFKRADEFFEYIFTSFIDDNNLFIVDSKTESEEVRQETDRLVRSFKFCSFDEESCKYLTEKEIANVNKDIFSTIDLDVNNWVTYKTTFGFSFKYPKDFLVEEWPEHKSVTLRFKEAGVLGIYASIKKDKSDSSYVINWNRMKILEKFSVNGEPVELIEHDQPEWDGEWTFPSTCKYYAFKNYSTESSMFALPSCVSNDYLKELERKVVESIIVNETELKKLLENETGTNSTSISQPPEESRFVNNIDKNAYYIFKDNLLGFSFLYPESWGEAKPVSSIDGFDTGKAVFISFTDQDNISFSVFENNFSQGISEGSLSYFDSNLNLENSLEEIKNFLIENNHFDILSLNKIEIVNKRGIKILGNRGYIKNQGSVSWLMPHSYKKNLNVMSILNLSDFSDKKYNLNEINEFLKEPKNLKYMEEVNKVFITMYY